MTKIFCYIPMHVVRSNCLIAVVLWDLIFIHIHSCTLRRLILRRKQEETRMMFAYCCRQKIWKEWIYPKP